MFSIASTLFMPGTDMKSMRREHEAVVGQRRAARDAHHAFLGVDRGGDVAHEVDAVVLHEPAVRHGDVGDRLAAAEHQFDSGQETKLSLGSTSVTSTRPPLHMRMYLAAVAPP